MNTDKKMEQCLTQSPCLKQKAAPSFFVVLFIQQWMMAGQKLHQAPTRERMRFPKPASLVTVPTCSLPDWNGKYRAKSCQYDLTFACETRSPIGPVGQAGRSKVPPLDGSFKSWAFCPTGQIFFFSQIILPFDLSSMRATAELSTGRAG